MVNKKGYIKTMEAVIAVILVIVVSYTLISRSIETPPEPPLVVQDAMRFINEKIQFDESLREGIVRVRLGVENEVESLIQENKPRNYDFTCAICLDSRTCLVSTPLERSIYVTDVFIASSKERQNPRIVRIWFWRGPTEMGELECGADCLNKCVWLD